MKPAPTWERENIFNNLTAEIDHSLAHLFQVRMIKDDQQAKLNVVRDVFGEKYPMISALKQAIAIYANDPAWRMVRPPLVELTAEQAKTLTAELKAIGLTMPELLKR